LFGQINNTDSICDLPSLLTYMDNHATRRHRTNATQSPVTSHWFHWSPVEVSVGLPMVLQPLAPFHPPPLSHTILSLLAILLLLQQEFLRAFTPDRATSSTCLQGQVLSISLSICSTQNVFLRSVTFAFLELCPKAKL
jgi:hypothetical protein